MKGKTALCSTLLLGLSVGLVAPSVGSRAAIGASARSAHLHAQLLASEGGFLSPDDTEEDRPNSTVGIG
ncbi:MAG: hypothetical protein ACFB9N_10185 [Geitlerinemataceae cyanobacterium]